MLTDEEIIKQCITDKGRINPHVIKEDYLNKHLELKTSLLKRYNTISNPDVLYREVIYRISNNIEEVPTCKVCGKSLVYRRDFGIYCSVSCSKRDKFDNDTIQQVTDMDIILKDLIKDGRTDKSKNRDNYLISHGYKKHLLSLYIDTDNIAEILYRYAYNISEPPKCNICGNQTKFISFEKGYATYCSYKCEHAGSIKNINDQYIIEKYGNDNRGYIHLDFLHSSGIYDYLNSRYNDQSDINDNLNSLHEVIYRIVNNIEILPVCEECGKPVEFNGDGYTKFCSEHCRSVNQRKQRLTNLIQHTGFDIEYKDYDTFIFHNVCNKHKSFEITPLMAHNRCMLDRYRHTIICPICNPERSQTTTIELVISDILEGLGILYEQHNRKILAGKELDFYLPEHNIGIECNAVFWHSTKHLLTSDYHHKKLLLCEDAGIKMISFWEDEILQSPDKVKSILMSKCGLNRKVHARQCTIDEIDSNTMRNFVNAYHLQGAVKASVKLGLFYNGELLEVMTFGKRRKIMGGTAGAYEYELYRLCTKTGYTITGGANKLLSYFKRHYDWNIIVSYCHSDISDGNVYSRMGFDYAGQTIGYFYYDIKENKRYNRFSLRKNKIDDGSGRTADKIIEEDYPNIVKCYNSGIRKYVMKNLKNAIFYKDK